MNTGTLSNHARIASSQFIKFTSRPASSAASSARDSNSTASGTQVSLSSQGLAASVSEALRGAPAFAQDLSRALHANPESARAAVESLAKRQDDAVVSIPTGSGNGAGTTYAATGQPVTAKTSAAFEKMSHEVQQNRLAIYDSEMAKGTGIGDIYDKMISYMDTLPKSYLDMANWK